MGGDSQSCFYFILPDRPKYCPSILDSTEMSADSPSAQTETSSFITSSQTNKNFIINWPAYTSLMYDVHVATTCQWTVALQFSRRIGIWQEAQ